eukprot:119041-Chlamydomonas_euryale.AAC.1
MCGGSGGVKQALKGRDGTRFSKEGTARAFKGGDGVSQRKGRHALPCNTFGNALSYVDMHADAGLGPTIGGVAIARTTIANARSTTLTPTDCLVHHNHTIRPPGPPPPHQQTARCTTPTLTDHRGASPPYYSTPTPLDPPP